MKYTNAWRLAAVGAIAAYASIFAAFLGFIGLTFTLLASSILIMFKAIGTKRLKAFYHDFIGS